MAFYVSKIYFVYFIDSTTAPPLAHADLPLTVDDILADKNRFRVGYR